MINALLVLNGFLAATILLVLIVAAFALWKIIQGRRLLLGIQAEHNQLVESVAKIDEKAQTALLTLDHIKLKNPI